MFLRLTLLIIGLAASYLGSLSLQGGAPADMAVGAGAILIGILCFFFLAKGLWRFLGCMTTFILMAIIVAVLFFFISGSDIVNNLTGLASSFMKKAEETQSEISENQNQPSADQVASAEGSLPVQEAPASAPEPVDPSLLVGLPPGALPPEQPEIPSKVSGKITSIVSGDVFRIGDDTVRLYGLATPIIDQKCKDASGHIYDCGYVAARMLKDFVNGDDVNCRVMNINAKGELMSACSVGSFDIGAAMVEAGWAIALPAVTQIYLPYQQKAQEGKKGMWEGQFQMPWEWAVQKAKQQQQQKERASIKVDTPKISGPRKVKKKSSGGKGLGFLGGIL